MTQVIQITVSILLFFIMFFGIAFILNMLLRRTWFMSFIYPLIVVLIVDNMSTLEYVKNPGHAFPEALKQIVAITPVDVIILGAGFAGTIVSGVVIKLLRRNGYQMF